MGKNLYNNISFTEGLPESTFSNLEDFDFDVSAAAFNNADFNTDLINSFSSDVNMESISGQYFDSSELGKINFGFVEEAAEIAAFTERVNKDTKSRLRRYSKKRRGGVLRYPLEALTEHTDYLQIDIEEYVPIGEGYVTTPGSRSRYVTGNYFGSDRAGRRTSDKLSKKPLINNGTILLPIPSNLQDTNQVEYGSSSLNGLAATGVQAAEGIMMTQLGKKEDPFGVQQVTAQVKKAKESVVGGVGTEAAATNALTKFLAAKAVNVFGANVTVNQLLARGNGEILNPNMELLFNGPTLRNFRFNFKLTPRNEKEAQQVKLIIRAFKRNMAPQAQGGSLSSGNWFLKTPNVFKLRYRSGRKNHPFLNRFKQCFLENCSVNYTGEGVHTTYDDGTPVSMILDLTFKEIQPIYDVDYDTRPGTEAVGY